MVPSPNDACWTRVLKSDKDLSAASLATKILVTRLRREVQGSPADMATKIGELRAYFEKNAFAIKDIAHF